MPIFEFVCQECGSPFEELVRSATAVDEVACPFCESEQVAKQISTFASNQWNQQLILKRFICFLQLGQSLRDLIRCRPWVDNTQDRSQSNRK